MRVLFSPHGTIYDDGKNQYYGTDVYTQIQRYRFLGDKMTVFMKHIRTDKPVGVKREPNDGIDIVYIEKINTLKRKLLYEKENDRIVKEAVKQCDICICHLPNNISYQTIKYAKKYGKPYLNVVVGCIWDALWNYDWRGKLLAPFSYLKLRKVQQEATHSIYVTKDFLQRRYPTKGKQIGASDVDIIPASSDMLDKRLARFASMPQDTRELSLCTLAAINPYKGQRYVIHAIAQLNQLGYKFTYHIVGDGEQTSLRNLAKKLDIEQQVIFHGKVHHDKVFELLEGIDIYIQPSKQEGLPRSMVEAMSRGCVPMGSNIAGIPELVPKECLFPKGNVKAIVSILSKMTRDKLITLSKLAYIRSLEYDSQKLQKQYHDFLVEFKNDSVKSKSS